jgi:hypothetical protein
MPIRRVNNKLVHTTTNNVFYALHCAFICTNTRLEALLEALLETFASKVLIMFCLAALFGQVKHADKQHGSCRDARRAERQNNRLSKHQERAL